MRINSFLPVFLTSIVSIMGIIGSTGCANMIPPQGGPRDSLPPVLLNVSPHDSTRNFKGNRIVFDFDEYVEIDNPQQNLVVSPLPQVNPQVESKLRTVTVRLKDTLEANTTYTINFGNAIKDFNEGNVLRNFTYVFSTGPSFDSLQLKGKVLLANSGKPDSTLVVMLHRNLDDSAVIKERPRYIAKLDREGNFAFQNIAPGKYALYALKDDGGTRRYMTKSQLFAFMDSAINLPAQTAPVTLYAYAKEEALPATGSRSTTPANTQDKRLKFTSNANADLAALDIFGKLELAFEKPLKTLDTNLVKLYSDSTYNAVTGYQALLDTSKTKLQITAPWMAGAQYHLVLQKDFAQDTLGRKLLRTDTLDFTVRKTTEYGQVKIKLRNLENYKNPVLQFYQNDKLVNAYPLSSADFMQPLMLPGEYELRILNDDNKNGVWDAGDFFKVHRQPEIIKTVDRKISIKPNWENEFEITAPDPKPKE